MSDEKIMEMSDGRDIRDWTLGEVKAALLADELIAKLGEVELRLISDRINAHLDNPG